MWLQRILFFLAGALFATACIYWYLDEVRPGMQQSPQATSTQQAGLANPASVNCVTTLGGTLAIVDEVNGEVGYCHLKDGRVCEEWSLFRDGSCVAPQ